MKEKNNHEGSFTATSLPPPFCSSSSSPVLAIYPTLHLAAVILHAASDLSYHLTSSCWPLEMQSSSRIFFPCKPTAQARPTNTGLLSQDKCSKKKKKKKGLHNLEDMRVTHQNNHEYPISAALPLRACFFPVSYQRTEARTQ